MSKRYAKELVAKIIIYLHKLFVIYDKNIGYPLFYNSGFHKCMYMLISNIWLLLEGTPYLPPKIKKLIEFKHFQSNLIYEEQQKYLNLFDDYYKHTDIHTYEIDMLEFIYNQVSIVYELYESEVIGVRDPNMPDYVEMKLDKDVKLHESNKKRADSPIYETID